MAGYDAAYAASLEDPQAFWLEAARAITWERTPPRAYDADDGPHGRWFPEGKLNTAFNCLDRHILQGHGSRIALLWESPLAAQRQQLTYLELRDRVARFAGALANFGVAAADRVVIYMPMVPEAVIAMLACARLGAIHSVVFGGFAPTELAKRIEDAKPRIIVSASAGMEPGRTVRYKPMLDQALAGCAHQPAACIILQRPAAEALLTPGRDYDFAEVEARAAAHPCVTVRGADPLYILYTSGTTGKPKGIVRDNGGHAVALLRSMRMIYGMSAGDVCFTASDIGWVVGHSYIVYGPLLSGCTTILYEGKPVDTPNAGVFWRMVHEYRANMLFTAPTAIRAIRAKDPEGKFVGQFDLTTLRAIFLAGERCDAATGEWLATLLGKPVVDHWWQTETGWALTGSFMEFGLFARKPGSAGRPSPGVRLTVLDAHGSPLSAGSSGNLAVALPLPPGAAATLWQDDEGFRRAYLRAFPGYYATGDAGMVDVDGDVTVLGRTDDIINVAGHRLSTGSMEEVVASHPAVVECAVVGTAHPLKGQVPLALFVIKPDCASYQQQIADDLVSLVRARIGPVASFRHALAVPRLPKTRSGKILRATLRRLADGEPANAPSTLDDPSSLEAIAPILARWRQSLADTGSPPETPTT